MRISSVMDDKGMRKKLISFILIIALGICFTACNSDQKSANKEDNTEFIVTEEIDLGDCFDAAICGSNIFTLSKEDGCFRINIL